MTASAPSIPAQDLERSRARRFIWASSVAAALQVAWQVRLFCDGRALRIFGEQPLFFELLFGLGVGCFALWVCVAGVYRLIRRAINRGRFLWSYPVGIAVVLITSILCAKSDAYWAGLKSRLVPVDEPAYLLFASQVRKAFENEERKSASLKSLTYGASEEDKRRAQVFLDLLPQSVFEDWPRDMLYVNVGKESVLLMRGSGRLGNVGVQIFDQVPEAQMTPVEEIRSNPYRHGEYRLSPRVLLLTGGN